MDTEKRFKIHPAGLFIGNDPEINAWASKINGYSTICINRGLIEAFKEQFMNEQVDLGSLDLYSTLQRDIGWPLKALMFQWSIRFIFMHETAHLIQFSCGDGSKLNEKYSMAATSENFSLKHHLYEIDADAYGGLLTGRAIGVLWRGLEESKRTEDNLYKLYICSLATIFLVFLSLDNPYEPIYYKAGDHPHPFVRTTHILPSVVDGIQRVLGSPQLQQADNVLQDTLGLTDFFLRKTGQLPFVLAAADLRTEIDNVLDYVKNVIHPAIPQFPELMVNQQKPRGQSSSFRLR